MYGKHSNAHATEATFGNEKLFIEMTLIESFEAESFRLSTSCILHKLINFSIIDFLIRKDSVRNSARLVVNKRCTRKIFMTSENLLSLIDMNNLPLARGRLSVKRFIFIFEKTFD